MYELLVRDCSVEDYNITYEKMRRFTKDRTPSTADEFWCLQHHAVFTLGANADNKHILTAPSIPIVQTDRGGQVTYHGPGQIIIYLLIDLRRKSLGVKQLVQKIEQSIVDLLEQYDIFAQANADAHGVYVNGAKIASLGLRVSRGCSYHGLALNVDMDLHPFSQINPCGFENLEVTQMKDFVNNVDFLQIQKQLTKHLCESLEYDLNGINTIGT